MTPKQRRADEQLYEDIKEIAGMKANLQNACDNIGKIEKALFGDEGIESRLRKVEVRQGFVAGGAAVISAFTVGLIEYFSKK